MFLHNYPYTLLDYSSALKHLDPLHYLPGCYLFCWCSQWMVQFLNIIYLFFLSATIAPVSAPCPTTVIILFISMYGSLQSQRLALSIMVLNLIWLFALYVQGSSSFTSIQFFVLNFYGWLSVLFSILWSSGTPFFLYIYEYNNHISETICCHFSGGLYVSLGVLVGSGICVDFFFSSWVLFEIAYVIFSGMSFSDRSSVASAIC